ncbi:protein kinase domain-containing protein [Andreprevotia chitinilytica]|uniref:protein kinase domain-containing protein n=1 Tax=Andreprevotia chitinilytica TaxID=396808 RepID=UPI00055585AC|nr:protein kinase [Andreprevotia chitinilytica]
MSELPKQIGKYKVSAELGRGSSGIVYLASDGFLGRQVAVKQLSPENLGNPEKRRRQIQQMRTEASLVGQLKHPHIVSLLDADMDAEVPYVVMEYVEGRSLEHSCTAEQLLPVGEVFDIAFKCCDALDYAQRHGLVHRDIKPANILRSDNAVKITDFGTVLSAQSDVTQIKGLIGSPAYMSPEQVQEQSLTHQSDIFSLGVVIYQLLTGALPFEADSDFATIFKITYHEPLPPTTLRPDLPRAVDALVKKALAKNPQDRFADWKEFARAIAKLVDRLPPSEEFNDDVRLFGLLRAMPFLQPFPDHLLWTVMRLGSWHQLAPGKHLIREGAQGGSFYLLVEGEVTVERHGLELARIKAGVTLGEMVYLRPGRPIRTASVIARTKLVVLKIRNDALEAAPEAVRAHFDRAFLGLLVERLDSTGRQLAMLDEGR